MQRHITLSRLKDAIRVKANSLGRSVEAFTGNDNPQVVEMRLKAQAELDAYTAVLDAINQRTVYFLEH